MNTISISFFRTTPMHNGEYVPFMSEADRQILANGVEKLGLGGLYPLFKDGLTPCSADIRSVAW
jgi:hypothetical protein